MKTLISFLAAMLFTLTCSYAQYNAGANSGSSGAYHTFLGRFAGQKNTTGSHNTFVGQAAGINNTKGVSNTFIGRAAGATNTQAHYNTFVGRSSGFYNTSGEGNTFMGYKAGHENTVGKHNTFIGSEAGYFTKSTATNNGYRNTYLGYRAGYQSVKGKDNVYLGYRAGHNNINGYRNVFIGFQAGFQETGHNKLYIANSYTTTPLIYGNFSTSELTFNGTVKIGDAPTAASAAYKLYVEEGILTEKVKVANIGSLEWADYVFEEDYELNSIEEVEQFVKTNKHLPNVPSAKEVEKNGVDMVEMDATLLRQVEELWLHVIELKKENETLKLEVAELKKQ